MAWLIRRQNEMVIRVGCHENRSEPGTAVYSMKAVTAPVIRWNTILTCSCGSLQWCDDNLHVSGPMQHGLWSGDDNVTITGSPQAGAELERVDEESVWSQLCGQRRQGEGTSRRVTVWSQTQV